MEDIVPPQTEQGAGFEPPHVRQFTVFLENRVGRLQGLVRAYEGQGGRIVALAIHNEADAALVRIIGSDAELAREVLRGHGFSFAEQDLLAVQLPQHPRPLTTVCAALLTAEISIHYAYAVMLESGRPALALYVDDPTLAAQIMIRKGFTLIAQSDLGNKG